MSSTVIMFFVKTAQNAQKKRREAKIDCPDVRLALEKKEKVLTEIRNLAARRQLF